MKKNWIPIIVVIIIIIVIAVFYKPAPKGTIKIGIVADLSGKLSVYGNYLKNGLNLALEEINSNGGIKGRKLEIIYEDGKSETNEAVTATTKLINVDKVSVIIGFASSNAVLGAAPIAEKAKVILFTPMASGADITNAGDYIFRNRESGTLHGEKMAGFVINELGIKKAFIIAVNSENGLSYEAGFTKKFEELKGEIVGAEHYTKGETDFRTILTKIKNSNSNAIYMAGYVSEMGEIVKQTKEFGINLPIFASTGIEAKEFFDLVKPPLSDGIIYTYPAFDPNNPAIADYQKQYEKNYGVKSEALAANSYDALKIIALVLKSCGENTICIKEELYKIKDYPGVGGLTTFDQNGDVIKPITFKTIKNGQFVPYENN
ncbi:ABC transporter substrate-binding protein [Patescibacteria group bacterium]|nr:ABC transporter substrate-binding protein [Patescibacteria group bacterium]MBU4458670.1 ABC transporter substrate-binding protein [Patescibacteria group bacterium]MCG2696265.1 ABC transporter substrate-binding protein [Candidatus Portnoybacteria bacterium]